MRRPVKPLPPADYLRACFTYDPEAGSLIWNARPRNHFATGNAWATWNARFSGTNAGSILADGYFRICLDAIQYKKPRIIFKLVTGKDPPLTIDHKDGDPANDRWTNLRAATPSQQAANRNRRADNASGYRGVAWDRQKNKWVARIAVAGRNRTLGRFAQIEDAAAAYETAGREIFGDFYRASNSG